jgi:hypothetical protein
MRFQPAFVAASFAALVATSFSVTAADPASGSISTTQPEASYSGGPFVVSNPSGTAALVCANPAAPCDDYALTVELPANYAEQNPNDVIEIMVTWPDPMEDYDLVVLEGDTEVGSSGNGAGVPESTQVAAGSGTRQLTVRVVPFTVTGGSYSASIRLRSNAPGEGPPRVASNTTIGGPRFDLYRPPGDFATADAAEPTLDVNIGNDNAFMLYNTVTLKTEFDDTYSPALTNWSDVSDPTSATLGTLDPIFVGDHALDADNYPDPDAFTRLFVVQLQGASSAISASDDEGGSWTPSVGGGQPHGADNQSMAGGPYTADSLIPHPLYRHAIYYCSHAIVNAFCSRSDNGGLQFEPSVPIFTPEDSISLACNNHGHVKVAPDGTVYVPQETCEGGTGLAVSEDNGLTWEYRKVPDAPPGQVDSSAGIARDSTLYYGYINADGRPWVGVSKDRARSFPVNQPIDGPLGINNTVWVQCVAGDSDRAACAFHGTTTPGDFNAGTFTGVWYTYLAYTYDGGVSWQVQDLVPGDPVQRGGICNQGINCPASPPNRNLLDFYDIVLDSKGRVLVGYADGCVNDCVPEGGLPTYSRRGVIARQAGGKTLFAKFDPVGATAPRAPLISGTRSSRSAKISWVAPFDGGAAVSGYRIFRGTTSGALTQYAESSKAFFEDTAAPPETTYYYQVSALNSVGESVRSNEIAPVVENIVETSPCVLPGVEVVTDGPGDTTVPEAAFDVRSGSVAEPGAFTDQLVFTLKMESLETMPPNTIWLLRFDAPTPPENGDLGYFVGMTTEAGSQHFVYGTYGLQDATATSASVYTIVGDIDPVSASGADGSIVMVANRALFGDLQVGENLTNFVGRVGPMTSSAAPIAGGSQDDTSGSAAYTVVGNASCGLTGTPLAILRATPSSGSAPLRVMLDGRDSSHPQGKTIATYIFDFNDGSAIVENSEGTVEHIYAQDGFYRPKLSVRDADGVVSSNISEAQVVVGNATVPGGGGGIMGEDNIRFGGALPLATLTLLGLVAALRRRRRHESL